MSKNNVTPIGGDTPTQEKPKHTCGDCPLGLHAPIDPMNIGAPKMVQCRALPPSAALVQTAGGGGAVAIFPMMQLEDFCFTHPKFYDEPA